MNSGCNYGYSKITLDLQRDGETCGNNRFLRSMRVTLAVPRSFFSSMKLERVKKKIYASCDEARLDFAQYVAGYYNYQRRYSENGGLSPKQFEDNAPRTLDSAQTTDPLQWSELNSEVANFLSLFVKLLIVMD